MSSNTINVLIVDDSAVSRDLLTFIVESDPQLKVIGTVKNGEEALEFLNKQTPDVIMLDIVMPKMNGYELTRRIMKTRPIPIIVVSGIYNKDEIATSFKAIEAGALAILEKPKGIGNNQYVDTARFVIQTIKAIAEAKVLKDHERKPLQPKEHHFEEKNPQPPHAEKRIQHSNIKAVAIGSSMGGPQALHSILSKLPATFPAPILIIQQFPKGLVNGLVDWLKLSTHLSVVLPKNGQRAETGYVYISPDDVHMEIDKDNIITLREEKTGFQPVPSIGVLFKSFAHAFGPHSVGIILTGVGTDGAEELHLMKKLGAFTVAQDMESSVMWDLPKNAIDLGAVSQIESLQGIPILLKKLMEAGSYSLTER